MPRQIPPFHIPLLLSLLIHLMSIVPTITAQSFHPNSTFPSSSSAPLPSPTPSQPALKIDKGEGSIYTYAGCWNESAGLPGTTGLRALDGASQVLPEIMTVGRCLNFCALGVGRVEGDTKAGAYRLAGLQFSRECWCGDELNPLSVPLPDAACDTPCDGANDTACGGALRLSLYNFTAWTGEDESGAAAWRPARGLVAVATTALLLGFALGGL